MTEMNDVLMPVAILGTFSAGLILFTKAITSYVLRKKMIEKGYVNEESQSIFKKEGAHNNKYNSLKWGLIVFFTGMALVCLEFIPYSSNSPFPFGFVAIFASMGFLVYYFLVKDKIKE